MGTSTRTGVTFTPSETVMVIAMVSASAVAPARIRCAAVGV